MSSTPTLYDTLGVTVNASTGEIRRAAKKMSIVVKDGDSSNSEKREFIKFLKRTRDTLSDPEQRSMYDETIGIQTIQKASKSQQSIVPFGSQHLGSQPLGSQHLGPQPFGSQAITSFGGMEIGIGNMMNELIGDLQSIIPSEIMSESKMTGRGGFHFVEYTKVRDGSGFQEYGFMKSGDNDMNKVTEKRFHRHT